MSFNRALRVRLTGDRVLAAKYLREGRVFVQYELDQMNRGGRTYVSKPRINASGVRFAVTHHGGQPILEIDVRGIKKQREIVLRMLEGFIAKPRDIGTAAANDGQNAFGQDAYVVLRPRGEEWETRFFEAANVPPGYPERLYGVIGGQNVLNDGLSQHGNVDWRDGAQAKTLNWIGDASRAIIRQTMQPYIFYNGSVVVDHDDYPPAHDLYGIVAACMKKVAGVWYVVYAASGTVNDIQENVLQIFRAPLEPHADISWWQGDFEYCPRARQVLGAEIELLLTVAAPVPEDSVAELMSVAFNQAANELTALLYCWNEELDALDAHIITVDVTDLDDVTSSVSIAATLSVRETFDFTFTAAPNERDIFVPGIDWETPDFTVYGLNTVPPGTYTATDTSSITQDHLIEDGFGVGPDYLITDATTVRTVTNQGSSAFPISVDYAQNQRSWLYYTPATGTALAAMSGSFSSAASGTHTGSWRWVADPDRTGPFSVHDYSESALDRVFSANASWSSDAEASFSGGRLYAQVEGEAAPWMSISFGGSYTSSRSGEASDMFALSKFMETVNVVINTDGDPNTSSSVDADTYIELDEEVTRDVEITGAWASTYNRVFVWWVDLRYKAAATGVITIQDDKTYSFTRDYDSTSVGSSVLTGGALVGNPPNVVITDPNPGDIVSVLTNTKNGLETEVKTYTVDTLVKFNGVTAYSASVTITDVNTSASITSDIMYGLYGIGLSGAFMGAAYTAVIEDAEADDPAGSTNNEDTGPSTWNDARNLSVADEIDAQYLDAWGWAETAPDEEPSTAPNNLLPHGYGQFIAWRGRWAYSIPELTTTVSTRGWVYGLADGDLDEATGGYGPELFTPFLPLSSCLVEPAPN